MPKTYSVRFDAKIPVRMRDGTTLYADVLRPVGRGKFPALLQRTPYDRTSPITRSFLVDVNRAAQRGYAVVIQDCRGRFASEGEFHTFVNEINDGYDTVEWTASQPWCDGNVGMFGGSYVGATQWLAAKAVPPSLKGIAPGVTASNYHEGWTYQGGAFELGFNLTWAAGLTGSNWDNLSRRYKGLNKRGLNKMLNTIDNLDPAFRHLPLKDLPELKGEHTKYYYAWLDHPEYDAYWQKLSIEESHSQIKAAAFNYGGWYDIFLGGTLQNYIRMKKMGATPAARKGQRLTIGPWVHGGSAVEFAGVPVGEHYFGVRSYSLSIDLHGRILRYYDHILKGMDNGVADEKPVNIFVMGDDVWRQEDDWPLKRAKDTRYYFHSRGKANTLAGDGMLSTESPGGETPDVFLYNPINPVPTKGGQLCCNDAYINPGAFDQRLIETRPDVLCYSTPPLSRDVEVTGPVTVTLYAASSARDTDFTAKLVDVGPDNSYARNLTDGIIRARYRKGGKAQLITPGEVYEYQIDLWATSNVFKKGHQIRVEISSSNFPRFDRNANTGKPNNEDPDFVTATQTILHDAKHPSHIVLPIVAK
ncbi:MAG: CocE/NonD family hydrolase [SAR202 cluster bacterium]|nr:CocE/NonD family hydrolase [SAR202 cluster bacterium]